MNDIPLRIQRFAHRLHEAGLRRSARLLTHLNAFIFHAILPPEPKLSEDLRLHHHALGVVMHPCVTIGRRVHLQHHVTLGTDVPLASGLTMKIGDDVSIGAHAVLLGPICVGNGASIGSGAVVIGDVAPGTTVVGNPARAIDSRASPSRS